MLRFFGIGALWMALCGTLCGDVQERKANNGNVILQDIPEVPQRIVEDLNRFQHIRGASLAGWQADGEGIYITTRFGEVNQLHRVDRAGGARRQLTFFPEPIGSTAVQPHGHQVAFLMDAGGNENAQIFVLDTTSGEHRLVSDGSSRNGSVVWHPDGKRIACQSTRRNGRSFDVWTMETGQPESAECVLETADGTWWGPVEFDAGGDQLLVQQYVSVTDSRIHLLDLSTGTRTKLLGDADDPSRNLLGEAAFAAGGDGFFLVTDQQGEFAQLAYYDLSSQSMEFVSANIPWDVEDVTLSDDKRRGAFVVNAGGVSQVYLFDPQTREVRQVKGLPLGVLGSMSFSPTIAGKAPRLAMTWSTSRTPNDVFVLSLGDGPLDHGATERWTHSEVGGLDTDAFVLPKLIRYPTFDQADGQTRTIPAFVYQPPGKGPFPVVVYIHGGPESQFRPVFASRFQLWVQQLGAAVIAPNVRGSAGYGKGYLKLDNGFLRENSVKDIGALLDWVAKQPELDQDRVAVYGGSYGGYMVLASAVHYSHRLKAAVDVVGISNFVTFLENTQDYRRDLRRVEYGDERDPRMRQHLENISPTNHVARIKVPMLVIQGQNDPRVPVTEAEQIVAALRTQGTSVWYMNALNEGHGYRKKENRDLYSQVVFMFLGEHLAATPSGGR